MKSIARLIVVTMIMSILVLGLHTGPCFALAPKSSQQTLQEMQKVALEKQTLIYAFLMRYPPMNAAFGKTFVNTHWQDLVELGKAAGENAWALYEYALPDLKKAYGIA